MAPKGAEFIWEDAWFRKGKFEQGKQLALGNQEVFHLTAFLFRGNTLIKMGTNSSKTHTKYLRTYKSGHCGAELHAEMSVLTRAREGDILVVMRWTRDGELSMAKPCEHCQRFIQQAKIKKVLYSDWNGQMQMMRVK